MAKYWRNELLQKEAELLDFVKSNAPANIEFEVLDTPIPNFKLPSNNNNSTTCCRRNRRKKNHHNDDEIMSMHSIKVTCHNNNNNMIDNEVLEVSPLPLPSPPLVLIHGYCGASMTFYCNLVSLAQIFGTVHVVDLLGWGCSSRPNTLSMFTNRQDCESFFVDSLHAWRQEIILFDEPFGNNNKNNNNNNNNNIILAGHSLGGYLCVAYAEKYKNCNDRLLLLTPAGVPDQRYLQHPNNNDKVSWKTKIGNYLWKSELLERIVGFITTKSLIYNVFGTYMTDKEQELLGDYLYANMQLPIPPIHMLLDTNSIAYAPLCHRIPNLQQEHIAFVYAERDTWMKVEYGLKVQRQYAPHDKIKMTVVIKDAGHCLNWKHPKAFSIALGVAAGVIDKHSSIDNPAHVPIIHEK